MLTDAAVMAIGPTTDLAGAKAFYGETLGLVDANAPTPGEQVIYQCGGIRYSRSTSGPLQVTRSTLSRRGM